MQSDGRIGFHFLPYIIGRQDIQHRQPFNPTRLVEGQAIADPSPAIMTDKSKSDMSERLHYRNDIDAHRPFRICRHPIASLRYGRPAIASQIRTYDSMALGQSRRNPVPHGVCLGEAMDKNDRRPTTTGPAKMHPALVLS